MRKSVAYLIIPGRQVTDHSITRPGTNKVNHIIRGTPLMPIITRATTQLRERLVKQNWVIFYTDSQYAAEMHAVHLPVCS